MPCIVIVKYYSAETTYRICFVGQINLCIHQKFTSLLFDCTLYCWWSVPYSASSTVLMAAYWKCTWPWSSLQQPSSYQGEGKSIHVLSQGQCYAEMNRLCGGTGAICASICSNQTVWVRQHCVVLWMESQSTLEIETPTLCVVVFSSFTAFGALCIFTSAATPFDDHRVEKYSRLNKHRLASIFLFI